MTELRERIRAFCEVRQWDQFHDPKNLCMALASEAGELAAVLRWTPNSESDAVAQRGEQRKRMLDEMGDVAFLLVRLCDRLGVDLANVIQSKLESNEEHYPVGASSGLAERPAVSRS